MNKQGTFPTGLTRRDLLKVGAFGLAGAAFSPLLNLFSTSTAFAAVDTLPDEQYNVSVDLALRLFNENMTYQWIGVSGDVRSVETKGINFAFPRGSRDKYGGWSISDLLLVTYKNVGAVNQRSLDVSIRFDKITISRRTAATLPEYIPFFISYDNLRPAFGNPNGTPFGYAALIGHQMLVDYTIIVTWADTGEVVNLPFYQRVVDIDLGSVNGYFAEAWTAGDGFTGDFFVYESCKLNISGNRFAANGSTSGTAAEIQQSGVVALTRNGKFSGQFEEDGCGTGLQIFTQFNDLPNPKKLYKLNV